jgi:hypothetical protein
MTGITVIITHNGKTEFFFAILNFFLSFCHFEIFGLFLPF